MSDYITIKPKEPCRCGNENKVIYKKPAEVNNTLYCSACGGRLTIDQIIKIRRNGNI